jgi:hypothetical protein
MLVAESISANQVLMLLGGFEAVRCATTDRLAYYQGESTPSECSRQWLAARLARLAASAHMRHQLYN